MQAYTVSGGKITAGIALSNDGRIHVGESGRGRTLVAVDVPPGAALAAGRVLTVPAKTPADTLSVVAHVHDHSGYRGGWRCRDPRTARETAAVASRTAAHAAAMKAVQDSPSRVCTVIMRGAL